MSLYLLAAAPLTFCAACAFLRDRPLAAPLDPWRRFALGGLLALPGYLAAGVAADAVVGWFDSSWRPAALFARLTVTRHLLPAVTAAAAALLVGLLPGSAARLAGAAQPGRAGRRGGAPGRTAAGPLGALAAMAGCSSIFAAAELAAGTHPPNGMHLLVMPTLRAATLLVLVLAWTRRRRPLAAAAIAASAVLVPGAASYLHAVGAHAPAGALAVTAAVAGAAALSTMRGRA